VTRASRFSTAQRCPAIFTAARSAQALLAEATVAAAVVLTDVDAMLTVRSHTTLPVVLVRRGDGATGGPEGGFLLGAAAVNPHAIDAADVETIRARLEEFVATVDLTEPFERIRAAIDEAQRH